MDLHSELFMVSLEICNHYDNLQNTATNLSYSFKFFGTNNEGRSNVPTKCNI